MAKKIPHLFLVGGCDRAKSGRNYYELCDLVEKVLNCIELTLGCSKFRFFDQQLGHINSISRLLDLGQCNNAYSAIQVSSVA